MQSSSHALTLRLQITEADGTIKTKPTLPCPIYPTSLIDIHSSCTIFWSWAVGVRNAGHGQCLAQGVCLKLFLAYFLARMSQTSNPTHQMQKPLWICKNSTDVWGITNEVKGRKYFISWYYSTYICFIFLSFLFSLPRSSSPTQCVYFPLLERTAGKIMNHDSVGYRRGFPTKLQSSQPSKSILYSKMTQK